MQPLGVQRRNLKAGNVYKDDGCSLKEGSSFAFHCNHNYFVEIVEIRREKSLSRRMLLCRVAAEILIISSVISIDMIHKYKYVGVLESGNNITRRNSREEIIDEIKALLIASEFPFITCTVSRRQSRVQIDRNILNLNQITYKVTHTLITEQDTVF